MISPEPTPTPSGATGPVDLEHPRTRRPRTRQVFGAVGAVVTVAVLVAAGFAVHWWRHPTLFATGSGSGFTAEPQPLTKAAEYITVAEPPYKNDRHERLTLTAARANYAHGEHARGAARSTFMICTYPAGTDPTTSGPDQFCPHVRPLHKGSVLDFNPRGTEQIVLLIRPLRRGSVVLTSVDLTYTRSWKHLGQRGTQRLPIHYGLTAN